MGYLTDLGLKPVSDWSRRGFSPVEDSKDQNAKLTCAFTPLSDEPVPIWPA